MRAARERPDVAWTLLDGISTAHGLLLNEGVALYVGARLLERCLIPRRSKTDCMRRGLGGWQASTKSARNTGSYVPVAYL
jgi:hypothetical protein